MCLAVDEIDDDLRRLVEYLNRATRADLRVTAVQLAYAKQGDVEMLVPSTFGGEIAETKARDAGLAKVRWSEDSFLEALSSESDREAARHLIASTRLAEGPNREDPLWFGQRPGGVIFLTPGGGRRAPVWLSVSSKGELMICGTWNYWTGSFTNHHVVYAELATLLGQDETQGARGVRVASLDLDAL